jgi:adenylate dimethylallyltransferase
MTTTTTPAARPRRLHLILGPTGVGKTGVAVETARTLGGPVIALDRIQCHREVAVGSGRPSPAELAGTRRMYLGSRPVAAGAIDPGRAIDRLVRLQQQTFSLSVTDLVLEGGSLSLLHELLIRSDWHAGASVHVTVCVESSAARYEAAVASRVETMLGYGTAEPTRALQDELAGLWDNPLARKAVPRSSATARPLPCVSSTRSAPTT